MVLLDILLPKHWINHSCIIGPYSQGSSLKSISKFQMTCTIEIFCADVCFVFQGSNELDVHSSQFPILSDEVVMDADVFCSVADLTILNQSNRSLVVVEQNSWVFANS